MSFNKAIPGMIVSNGLYLLLTIALGLSCPESILDWVW
jgi:hypothetical protein